MKSTNMSNMRFTFSPSSLKQLKNDEIDVPYEYVNHGYCLAKIFTSSSRTITSKTEVSYADTQVYLINWVLKTTYKISVTSSAPVFCHT